MKLSRANTHAQKPRFAVSALASKAVKVSKAKGPQARLCPSDW